MAFSTIEPRSKIMRRWLLAILPMVLVLALMGKQSLFNEPAANAIGNDAEVSGDSLYVEAPTLSELGIGSAKVVVADTNSKDLVAAALIGNWLKLPLVASSDAGGFVGAEVLFVTSNVAAAFEDARVIVHSCTSCELPDSDGELQALLDLSTEDKSEVLGLSLDGLTTDISLTQEISFDVGVVIGSLDETTLTSYMNLLLVAKNVEHSAELFDAPFDQFGADLKLVVAGVNPNSAAWHRELVASGVEQPNGGYQIDSDQDGRQRVYVALYGTPESRGLGVLGEQDTPETIQRAKELVVDYEEVGFDVDLVPTLEIITTVASASPMPDQSYSRPVPKSVLRPLIAAAAKSNQYVVLDLQPGRTDFLTQAKLYEEFLRQPHVGLALDPEWRLEPDEKHLRQVGSVTAGEVNKVSDWLAELTRENVLPQKMLLVHQFQTQMIRNRENLVTDHPEISLYIQMDGQGSVGSKYGTYDVLLEDAPDNVTFGWKNFYDEDTPGPLTPLETLEVEPRPGFISYQ